MGKRRKWLFMVAILVTLGGCGGTVPADQAIVDAYRNLVQAESYVFDAEVKVRVDGESLNLPPKEIRDLRIARGGDHPLTFLVDKDTKLILHGAYDRNRSLLEAEVELIAGYDEGSRLNLHSVIVMTEEHTWIKIPEALALAMGRPELIDKYYDLGYGYKLDHAEVDFGKFGEELLQVAVEDFKGLMLTEIDEDEAGATEDAKVVQAGRLSMTDSNLESILTTGFTQTIPGLIDVWLKPEWVSATGADEDDLRWEKNHYEKMTSEEIAYNVQEMRSGLEIHQANLDLGMDKQERLTHADSQFDVTWTSSDGQDVEIQGHATLRFSEYNKPHEFQYGIPRVSEVFFE